MFKWMIIRITYPWFMCQDEILLSKVDGESKYYQPGGTSANHAIYILAI